MDKDTFLNGKTTLNLKGELLDLSKPWVMGILNITPDSFFNESRNASVELALNKAAQLLNEGAQIIDIGGYSSRPGAADVSPEEEADRVLPLIEAIAQKFPSAYLSIDTFRGSVARQSIAAGAHIINDISGFALDDDMLDAVATLQVPYILMHMKGNPQSMQQSPSYENITLEVVDYFVEKLAALRSAGVKDIILDPGFGFAKKILRVKQIEDNAGATLASEGVHANYQDMLNYAVFALIKLGVK